MLPPHASTARQESSALAGGFRETPFPLICTDTLRGPFRLVKSKSYWRL